MSPLLKWFRIVKWQKGREAIELAQGRLMAAYAGLEALDQMAGSRVRSLTVESALRKEYEEKIEAIEKDLGEMQPDRDQLRDREMRWARRHLLLEEKNRVINAFQEGRLSLRVYEQLLADIDALLLAVETEI